MLVFPYRYRTEETPIEIVSWSSGTIEQIKAMVTAEKAGKINTANYWNVGDKRAFHLAPISAFTKNGVEIVAAQPSQTLEIALAHKGLYNDSSDNVVSWIVSFANCLAIQGKMNGTNTNAGSWDDSNMREYINDYVFPAMSTDDRALFTQFKTVTAKTYNGSEVETSLDYLALPAEKEIFGAETYSNQVEDNALTQFDYYKSTESHSKTANGSLCYWWQRSPCKDFDSAFCLSNVGSASFSPAININGISPFGCI